ncbi:MAG: hypothetical protein M3P33_01605 [bacterium]|nr:hypothetical protein [bacterium]
MALSQAYRVLDSHVTFTGLTASETLAYAGIMVATAGAARGIFDVRRRLRSSQRDIDIGMDNDNISSIQIEHSDEE